MNQLKEMLEAYRNGERGLPTYPELVKVLEGQEVAACDAERYRWLRNQPTKEGFPPEHGSVWVVQYNHPNGTIPDLRSAGFGMELDIAVDKAILSERAK